MKKIFTFIAALTLSVGLWASNVITYTATEKLTTPTVAIGETTFGSSITGHEFANGIGTITCRGEITMIGDYAFNGCFELISITIPSSVTTIGHVAFADCSRLTAIDVDAANIYFASVDGALFNYARDTLIQYPIGNQRTEYVIPSSVTTIGISAFSYGINLTSITIPSSVTTIGTAAFNYCSGLTSISIPSSVTTIGDEVFADCQSLTSITIPSSVTTIGNQTFSNCFGLSSITIPSSVATIGYGAFADCHSLTAIDVDAANIHFASVDGVLFNYARDTLIQYPIGNQRTEYVIPSSVTAINSSAFSSCSSLTSITIPSSVTTMGGWTFVDCIGLTSITIPSSITTIGDAVFSGCIGLISVTIPSSVTTIGEGAFRGCTGLTSISIPSSVITIDLNAFEDVNNIMYNGTADGSPWGAKCVNGYVDGYLVYSDANKTILCGCSSAVKGAVTIPNSVITIEDDVFKFCFGLTSVTIPSSVTEIGEFAFYYCKGLTSITCDATVPPVCGYGCFSYVETSIPLYVPSCSVETYKEADEWKNFSDIRPNPDPSALHSILSSTSSSVKFLHNGQLFIRKGDKTYTIMGLITNH